MTPPVMIFAAGFGTRMQPLTATRPKPLISVAGRPLIDHALDLARDIAPPKLVVNAHYLADQIKAHLAGSDVIVLTESPEILDTGGGLKAAAPVLDSAIALTMNPDCVFLGPNPLQRVLDHWDDNRMEALLLCVPPSRAHATDSQGDFDMAPDGRLLRGPGHTPGYIHTGVQIIRFALLDELDASVFSLNSAWDVAAQRGGLFGHVYPGAWCDIGHPAGIGIAEALLNDDV